MYHASADRLSIRSCGPGRHYYPGNHGSPASTAPATEPPATEPPEETTLPAEPVLSPELWLTDPEYPSYAEFFSQDRRYGSNYRWIVQQEETYLMFSLDYDSEIAVSCDALEGHYLVPDSEATMRAYDNLGMLGTDGKYAYFYNDTRIIQVELLTGSVTVLVEADMISAAYLCGGAVLYYICQTGENTDVCRLYIPDMTLDVLHTLEHPEYLFEFNEPRSTLGSVTWYGLSPQIMELAIAEWENPNSSYKKTEYVDYSHLWEMWANGELCTDWPERDLLECFFCDFEMATGVYALLQGSYNCIDGSYSEKLGTLDMCFVGTGSSHDHFSPEITHVDVAAPKTGPWQELPGQNIQGKPEAPNSEARSIIYSDAGFLPGYLYLSEEDGTLTKLLDTHVVFNLNAEDAIYCITENTIVQLSYDGSVCNTIYAADNGELKTIDYYEGNLYVLEEDRALQIDLANNRYRVLVEQPHIWGVQHWEREDVTIIFSVSHGLFDRTYLYSPETGEFEEYPYMW